MKKILVADDDTSILDAIKIILEDEGYVVETTPDGGDVRSLKGELPGLILLDIWMSGSDGSEICKFLKSKEDTKNISIIMISASTEIEKLARDAHADGFIMKPFDIEDLIQKIKKYC